MTNENEKNKTGNIIKIIILVLIISWIALFFVDYFKARKGISPTFCLKEETKTYDDGTVYSCTSFGYKMYKYNRTSVNASIEFGPFFLKERGN